MALGWPPESPQLPAERQILHMHQGQGPLSVGRKTTMELLPQPSCDHRQELPTGALGVTGTTGESQIKKEGMWGMEWMDE